VKYHTKGLINTTQTILNQIANTDNPKTVSPKEFSNNNTIKGRHKNPRITENKLKNT